MKVFRFFEDLIERIFSTVINNWKLTFWVDIRLGKQKLPIGFLYSLMFKVIFLFPLKKGISRNKILLNSFSFVNLINECFKILAMLKKTRRSLLKTDRTKPVS